MEWYWWLMIHVVILMLGIRIGSSFRSHRVISWRGLKNKVICKVDSIMQLSHGSICSIIINGEMVGVWISHGDAPYYNIEKVQHISNTDGKLILYPLYREEEW